MNEMQKNFRDAKLAFVNGVLTKKEVDVFLDVIDRQKALIQEARTVITLIKNKAYSNKDNINNIMNEYLVKSVDVL